MGIRKFANKKPCLSCGENKKYKKCCLPKDLEDRRHLFIINPCIVDRNGDKHFIDKQISNIYWGKRVGDVTENDFLQILSNYNLIENLKFIGKYSEKIFHNTENEFGKAACKDEFVDVLISQFSLAYIANMLILSPRNGDKLFSEDRYSFAALCNMYSNKLVSLELKRIESNVGLNENDIFSYFIRLWYEQMGPFQFDQLTTMTRSIAMFFNLSEQIPPKDIDPLPEIFLRETGITLREYLEIGFGFLAGTKDRCVFKMEYLTASDIPEFYQVFTKEKVKNFFDVISIGIEGFIAFDKMLNKELNPIFTKNRLNVLSIYPLIKVEDSGDNIYIMPNVSTYTSRLYNGVFWWFQNYFEELEEGKKKTSAYRSYFGKIFEEYVGLILKDAYGEDLVNSEISYDKGKNKFTDWYVIKDDVCYLFEAKSYQFSLLSKQTGDLDYIKKKEIYKVAEAVKELFKTVRDVDLFDELAHLRGKTFIPIVVFFEVPLASSPVYKNMIKDLLVEMESSNNDLLGLSIFEYNLVNIDELEHYGEVEKLVPIEKIFDIVGKDIRKGFSSYATEIKGSTIRNRFLDKTYNDFWRKKLVR